MIVTDSYADQLASVRTLPGQAVVVTLSGDLDFSTARATAAVDDAVRANLGGRVVVDLREVTFLDVAALRALAGAKHRATAGGGALCLLGAGAFAQTLLDIYHL